MRDRTKGDSMFTWIRVMLAARALGLRDRGVVQPRIEWNSKIKDFVTVTRLHTFCQTRIRVGLLKKRGKSVHWCYRCEEIVSDNGNNGGGGNTLRRVPPTSPDDESPKMSHDEAQKAAEKVLERMRK